MSLDTFSGLRASIQDHLDNDDLITQLDDFITLAESRHKRDIRIQEMITRQAIAVNARQIALPDRMLEALNIRLLTNPATVLEYKSPHELTRVRREGTGKPTAFTIGAEIEFDIAPDSAYAGEILFYQAFTPLAEDNPTNALLERAPDAYLYAALTASAPFLMNDERITVWNQLYQQASAGLSSRNRQRRQVGPLIARPAGATP